MLRGYLSKVLLAGGVSSNIVIKSEESARWYKSLSDGGCAGVQLVSFVRIEWGFRVRGCVSDGDASQLRVVAVGRI